MMASLFIVAVPEFVVMLLVGVARQGSKSVSEDVPGFCRGLSLVLLEHFPGKESREGFPRVRKNDSIPEVVAGGIDG
jgi:hypothetical protein